MTMKTKSELDKKRDQIIYLRNRIKRDQSEIVQRELALKHAIDEYNKLSGKAYSLPTIPDRANAQFPFMCLLYRLPQPGMERPKNQRTTLLLLREGRYSDAIKHYQFNPQFSALNSLIADAANTLTTKK